MRKLLLVTLLFFVSYTFFWINFFSVSKPHHQVVNLPQNTPWPQIDTQTVLAQSTAVEIPKSYSVELLPRRQAFNLSCEFAAGAAIIHYFTNDKDFSSQNEESAEKKLAEKIGVSQNPNVGIRMGDILEGDFAALFKNLNQRFGGADYYGVHAPPFIDLFAEYGLIARPLFQDNAIFSIQNAIFHGHLVMAWIQIGYGKTVDTDLSYGDVPVVKGEHVVVINGYDESGVNVMDPATSSERHLFYSDLIRASESFPLPFLEIFPSIQASDFKDIQNEILKGSITGLNREKLTVKVENGSGLFGSGTQMSNILKDFGFKITGVSNADSSNYENVSVKLKNSMKDYQSLLERDLRLSNYKIATISSDLSESSPESAIIIVGK